MRWNLLDFWRVRLQQDKIGIGGPLTRPPLPHHRAYGSVPRRFGGLSVYQLFHGEEAQTGEASFGEGPVQSFHGAQPPGSLRAEDSRTGQPFGDLETAKFPISPAARLPLDPNDASQSPSAGQRVQVNGPRWRRVSLALLDVLRRSGPATVVRSCSEMPLFRPGNAPRSAMGSVPIKSVNLNSLPWRLGLGR